jgi:ketosteroid isomerase-like protein
MNYRGMLSVLVAPSLLLAGCAPASSPETTEADIQALREMSPQFLAAFNAGESTAEMFTEDAVRMAPHLPDIVGQEAIRENDLAYFADFTATQTATTDEVQVYGDVGFARGTWRVLETPKAGGDEVERNGKWLIIFERQSDGQWKATRHIWNQEP